MRFTSSTGFVLLLGALIFGCSSAERDAGAMGGSAGMIGGSGGGYQAGAPGQTIAPADWPEQEGLGSAEGDPPPSGELLDVEECNAANPQKLERLIDFVPADTNARGSAALAREALEANQVPLPYHLRTHELLGYYAPDLSLAVDQAAPLLQLRKHPEVLAAYELLVAIQIPPLAAEARPPVALTLAIDTTLSMQSVLDRARSSLGALGGALRAGDVLTWLTSDAAAPPIQLPITGPTDPQLANLIEQLDATIADQPTSLSELVSRGVQRAREQMLSDAWNRVVVITDGEDDLDESAHLALKEASMNDGVTTMAVGVGHAFEHSPRSLRLISHAGRGPWIQIDGQAESESLRNQFTQHFGIAYDDVHVHVTVPWYFEIARPYAFETSAPDAVPSQYLAPGQIAVFPFRLTACSELAVLSSDTIEATFQWTNPATGLSESVSLSRTLDEMQGTAGKSSPLRHVFAVLAYAEALRALDPPRLERARAIVDSAYTADPNEKLAEILGLLDKHPLLLP